MAISVVSKYCSGYQIHIILSGGITFHTIAQINNSIYLLYQRFHQLRFFEFTLVFQSKNKASITRSEKLDLNIYYNR